MLNKLLMAGCLMLFTFSALAVESPLPDAAQEARAYALFHQIRCVVCLGQSIADSPADVAADMRRTIRERVAAGDGTDDIKTFLISRYGDAILMRPPLTVKTAILWGGPTAMLLLACGLIWIGMRRESAKDKKQG